jgi:hypothetical protein
MTQIVSNKNILDTFDIITETIILPIYFVLIVALYFGYTLIILGSNLVSLQLVNYVKQATEILIGITLSINFNPYRKLHITTSDAHIIFAAGTFLVANVLIENAAFDALLKSQLGISVDAKTPSKHTIPDILSIVPKGLGISQDEPSYSPSVVLHKIAYFV